MLLKVLPKIRLSTAYGGLTGEEMVRLRQVIRPGDIIFSRDPHKITTLLIPGQWSHVGIVVDDFMVVEALPGKGVVASYLHDFCQSAREVALARPYLDNRSTPDLRIKGAIDRALDSIGTKYDGMFTIGPKALYCAELIDHAYRDSIQFDWSDVWGIGMPYLTPDGVFDGYDVREVARFGK